MPTQKPQPITQAVWVMLVALSLLWGGSFPSYRQLALEHLPPTVTVAARIVLGAAFVIVLFAVQGTDLRIARRDWPRLLLFALGNNILPYLLFAWAEQRISGGTAAILNAMTPIFTLLVTGLVLRTERFTPNRILGIGCGFLGVAILVGPAALVGQDVWGQLACLAAAICYGFALPFGRTLGHLGPRRLAVGQLVAASVIAVPLMLIVDPPSTWPPLDRDGVIAVLTLGLLATGLAFVLFFRILERAGATNLSLVTFLVPVSAIVFGAVLLDEPIGPRAVAGMVTIGAGLACIDGRLLRLARKRSVEAA